MLVLPSGCGGKAEAPQTQTTKVTVSAVMATTRPSQVVVMVATDRLRADLVLRRHGDVGRAGSESVVDGIALGVTADRADRVHAQTPSASVR